MPKVIEVIESEEVRGKGTSEDPMRRVVMYFTLDGEFLAENDPRWYLDNNLPTDKNEVQR